MDGTALGVTPMPVLMNDFCHATCIRPLIRLGAGGFHLSPRIGRRLAAPVFLLLGIAAPTAAQTPDTTPSGMVAFFMSSGAGCPAGWSLATNAQGRLLVGVATGVGTVVDSPMADQTAPTHDHGYYPSVTLPSRNIAATHCCNNQGAHSGTYVLIKSAGPPRVPSVFTQQSTSNLPFIQLVICQKQ